MTEQRLRQIEDHVSYIVSTDDRIVTIEIITALRESQARETKLREQRNSLIFDWHDTKDAYDIAVREADEALEGTKP